MYGNLKIHQYADGTCDVILEYSSNEPEFALDFMSTSLESFQRAIKRSTKNLKVRSVKILVAGVLVSTIAFSTLFHGSAAGSDKYSMAYIYTGTTAQQISYIERTNSSLDTVSPNYFDINTDGSLKVNPISQDFVNRAHALHMKVVPYLSNNWDRQGGINALKNYNALATQLATLIANNNLDGINIDIENVTELQRDQYTAFVASLQAKIPEEKEISVAVAANPNNWTTGWHGSYDYAKLAQYADHLLIMTYDEHFPGGSAGPIASIGWVENSVKYALKHTSCDKIMLGLPFFGRIWSSDGNFMGNGLNLTSVNSAISTYNAKVSYDPTYQSPKAEFTITDKTAGGTLTGKALKAGNYTIWYENNDSYAAKLALVGKYNLKGAGSWALGQEPANFWDNYGTWLNGAVAVDAPTAPSTPTAPTAPTTPTTPTAPATSNTKTGTVIGGDLNVRSTPSAKGTIVTILPNGSTVNIDNTLGNWYRITLDNGSAGYVSSEYIRFNTPAATQAGTVNVSSGSLNVRSSPSTGGSILTTLTNGTPVNIVETLPDWYRITLSNGTTGYVSRNFITLNTGGSQAPAPSTPATNTKTASTTVTLRSTPTANGTALGTLLQGTSVKVLGTVGNYSIISYNGRNAYLLSQYLK